MKNEHILQIKLDELMNMSHRVAVMREGRVVNILNTPETTREEVLSSRISSAIPTIRAGFELQSIGAVVICGTPLTGGKAVCRELSPVFFFWASLQMASTFFTLR